ncbi:hypothetical protein [Chitinophaga japonensis]|uniref:Uncharacterized protein n=1 Tax=Chitinophaga japonensis TaxID=104662 RepID=A0A562SY94_CHIJA|nr:hypothetical protein [Chitinophaga japonensis]TWI86317.1 hypothetical protein LX66_3571 [Chitinophaga japonensis]
MTYEENVRLKAEELVKIRYPQTYEFAKKWSNPPEGDFWARKYYKKQLEYMTEQMLPLAAKALEWAAEIAHAVNGPQFSKDVIDSMLVVLGVIPDPGPSKTQSEE